GRRAARRRERRGRAHRRAQRSPPRARVAGARSRTADPVREGMRELVRATSRGRRGDPGSRRPLPGRVLAPVRTGAPGIAAAHRAGRARGDPSLRQLAVGRATTEPAVSRAQRRHLSGHGGPRVRPGPLAERPGVRRAQRDPGPVEPGPRLRRRPGQRPGHRASLRGRQRVRVARPLLPRRGHGQDRGLRDARRGSRRLPRPDGWRAGPARRTGPPGRRLCCLRAGWAAHGSIGRRRRRGPVRGGARCGRDPAGTRRCGRCDMTEVPDLRIGIVGYGSMGRAHSYGYRAAPNVAALPMRPRVTLISGRDEQAVAAAATSYGAERWTTDWRALVSSPDVDVVDICTPPGTHAEIAEAAAAAGKAMLSEKPLATSYRRAWEATAAVARAGVRNAIGFNYRRLPAVALMRRMIADGAIGEVRLWRGIWLSDEFTDPATPFDWRFDREMGGTTIADLGSHMLDMALWMVGPIEEVTAQSATFIRSR